MKLKKALDLRKAKYIRREGISGHYKYIYKEVDSNVKKIDVKKVVNSVSREFKINVLKLFSRRVTTEEQKVRFKKMINSRNKILTDILNGVNNNKLISFEGRGIMSGLDEYYKLVGYNVKTGEIEIKKKGSNKIFLKRAEDLLGEKEKYNIKG